MKNIKLTLNSGLNETIVKFISINGNMGDFYILQNTDLLKEMNMDSDVLIDIVDNYEDVQLGLTQNESMAVIICYPKDKSSKVESILDSFISELRGSYEGVSIFDFSKEISSSDINTFLLSINNIYDTYRTLPTFDEFKESVTRLMYILFKNENEEVETLMETLDTNTFNISQVSVLLDEQGENPDTTATPVESNKVITVDRRDLIARTLIDYLVEYLVDVPDSEVPEAISSLFKHGVKNEEVNLNQLEVEAENITPEETDTISDEEYQKITNEILEDEVSTESLNSNENKMTSERALELVKFLNNKWLKEIFPNILHKLENIVFFKENMSKFKINEGDKSEDMVAKVSGGVVHLEILAKNLSKWNNDNENWKIDATHKIKKNQRAWRKEYSKFKHSLLDMIKPLLDNILNKDEELDIEDNDNSISLSIIDTTEKPVTPDVVEENYSSESLQETNIYDKVSLESLMETITDEEELFNEILNNKNVENRDELILKGTKFNLITNNKLDIQSSIKRRVKIQNHNLK